MPGFDVKPTMVHHFRGHVQYRPDKPCVWFHENGEATSRTWRELGREASRIASALQKLGVGRTDRVAFISPNRFEWIAFDLAVLGLGAVHMPIHNSLTGPQMRFQIVDSESKVVVVAGDEQAEKLAAAPLPGEIAYAALDATTIALGGRPVPRIVDLVAPQTDPQVDSFLETAIEAAAPNELATILYTSGTTGDPKGVMLSHRNLTTNAEGVVAGFGGPQDERRLNLLPFSHIFARTCDMYCWLVGGSEMALADKPQTAIDDACEFQPRILNAVPYFYDRVMRKMLELGVADMPDIARDALGGKIEYCCSGGAPLPEYLAVFFRERGVLLVQGYGLTETSPVITMNTPAVHKHGTSGRPLPDVEVKIADDGEILSRGPHIMLGYWKRPQETAEALRDGWFHTGDLGEIDADGYLKITGRKKELIVTLGGKKIVPAPVEALITADPLICQAALVGDGRKFVAALVVPDVPGLKTELHAAGIECDDEAVLGHPKSREIIEARIRERLCGLSHYEQVQKVCLLPREFSIERDEMTLTMKMRREQIAQNFAAEIEAMYAG